MSKNNILRESISFPLGTNFIVRKVASTLRMPVSEARSIISLFKDGHAAEPVAKRLGAVLNDLKSEWLVKFQESLSNLSHDIFVPSDIYLRADKEMHSFFLEAIKTEQFNQYTLTQSKFKVTFLDPEVFHGMALYGENVIRDSSLIVDSIYINRFLTHI